jgi:caffeoyl-CoA O-methyltransferase
MKKEFSKQEVDQYCAGHSVGLSETAIELMEYTKAHIPMSMMLIGPLEAAFLKFMIRSMNVKKVLEVGTYTGFSSLIMAEALPEDGKVVTLDINEETTELAKNYWERGGVASKVESHVGEAVNILPKLEKDFDLVFIDADKTNYVNYYEKALEMTKDNGIILIDNCLWSNSVINKVEDIPADDLSTHAIKKLNQDIANDPRVESVLTPIRDGIMMVRKRGLIGEKRL